MRPVQQRFNQPGMAFPNNPTPHQATPYHQTEYQTPAALQSPNVPMPQQPMQMPGQSPMMGGGVGVGPQGPPVGAVPPGAGLPPNATTPPQTPKGPTPSETSSNQRNQLAKWESDEPLGDQATIAMILYSNQNHPELKSQYPEWKDRIKQIAKIWKNLPNDKRQPYVQNARENRTASRINKHVNPCMMIIKIIDGIIPIPNNYKGISIIDKYGEEKWASALVWDVQKMVEICQKNYSYMPF